MLLMEELGFSNSKLSFNVNCNVQLLCVCDVLRRPVT